MLYNRWLVKWDEGCFLQGELDNIEPGVVMNRRAEMWLEEADEFGILVLSIGKFHDIPFSVFRVRLFFVVQKEC